MRELTPDERALLAKPGSVRGYTPRDGVAEPDSAPAEPAGASAPKAEVEKSGAEKSGADVDVAGPQGG